MSGGYIGRRGINVSAYLQDLNTLPSTDEQTEVFNPDDLDIWTNTQFFDFDMGAIAQDPTANEASTRRQQHHQDKRHIIETPANAIAIDPSLKDGGGEFHSFLEELKDFDDFNYQPVFVDSFTGAEVQSALTKTVLPPTTTAAAAAPTILHAQPIASTPPPISAYSGLNFAQSPTSPTPSVPAAPASTTTTTTASPTTTTTTHAAPRGSKRKASVSVAASTPGDGDEDNLEDASRLAAEEDKRRRNTAASARFRVKKKQKEQQLEKTAKEMTDRVQALEQRIQQLELENKWLKGLIVEKNGGKSGEEMMMPPSILTDSKDGVGTIAEN